MTDPATLKPADRADETPRELMLRLLDALRDATRDIGIVRDDLVSGKPPSRLIARSVEAFEAVGAALDIAEQLAPALDYPPRPVRRNGRLL